MTICALPGLRSFCASCSCSNLRMRALLLVWRAAGVCRIHSSSPLSALELEDPADHVIEEVAVVGDHQHRAGIFLEMIFEPFHALGVEMVGRFVEQQDAGLLHQQPRQRHAALFAAGQVLDAPVRRRAAQRFHRDLELVVERPAVDRVDLLLQLAHLGQQRVEIGVILRIAHLGRDCVEAVNHVGDLARAVLHVLEHALVRIEFRLLRQVAHGDVLARPGFAGKIGVDPGHDLHQGGLARAVGADDADLGALVELQVDVAEHRLLCTGEALGHALHDVCVLGGHGGPSGIWRWRNCRADRRRRGRGQAQPCA